MYLSISVIIVMLIIFVAYYFTSARQNWNAPKSTLTTKTVPKKDSKSTSELSTSQFSPATTTFKWYTQKNGNFYVISTGVLVEGADPDSFEEFNLTTTDKNDGDRVYAKDKNHAYYFHNVIQGADPASFRYSSSTGLFLDNSHYYDGMKQIAGIKDVNSFKKISTEGYYKDKFNVYTIAYEYEPSSDGILYMNLKPLLGADSQTFLLISDHDTSMCAQAKDKNHVYYINQIMQDADPLSFRYSSTTGMCRDNLNFYKNGHTVSGIKDIDSFERINQLLFKDKYNTYSENSMGTSTVFTIVKGIDLKTFTDIDVCASAEKAQSDYYKDKNHVYIDLDVQVNIDAATFEYLGNFNNSNGMGYSVSYARDKNNVYFGCGSTVDEDGNRGDRATFVVLKDGYARDKNRMWHLGKEVFLDSLKKKL